MGSWLPAITATHQHNATSDMAASIRTLSSRRLTDRASGTVTRQHAQPQQHTRAHSRQARPLRWNCWGCKFTQSSTAGLAARLAHRRHPHPGTARKRAHSGGPAGTSRQACRQVHHMRKTRATWLASSSPVCTGGAKEDNSQGSPVAWTACRQQHEATHKIHTQRWILQAHTLQQGC